MIDSTWSSPLGCVHLYLHYSVPGGPIAVPLDPGRGEDWVLAEGFRSDMLVWLRLEGLRVASRCHLRVPLWFNGRSWKPPSRATSSPTSPCATSRSTARIPGTISSAWPGRWVGVFHKGQSQRKRTLHAQNLVREPHAGASKADSPVIGLACSAEVSDA